MSRLCARSTFEDVAPLLSLGVGVLRQSTSANPSAPYADLLVYGYGNRNRQTRSPADSAQSTGRRVRGLTKPSLCASHTLSKNTEQALVLTLSPPLRHCVEHGRSSGRAYVGRARRRCMHEAATPLRDSTDDQLKALGSKLNNPKGPWMLQCVGACRRRDAADRF